MKIDKLKLKNFRNFKDASFAFANQNVVIGANASGKSTILEAISTIATTKSDRAEYDKEMIRLGTNLARLEAEITRDEEKLKLELIIQSNPRYENLARKQVKVNGVSKPLNVFAGNLNAVLFTPSNIEIITAGPQIRRRYMDTILFQISSEYRHAHTNYSKIVKNRNKILEKINEEGHGHSELNIWNTALLKEGVLIHKYRHDFFDAIGPVISRYGKELDTTDLDLKIYYKPNSITSDRLKEYEPKEIAAKQTLLGPNRDDFYITFNTHDIEKYGSRGQQRLAILALKSAEIDFIASKVHARPVLLLDDIFSELDSPHREHIFNIVHLQQTIIATTTIELIEKNLKDFNIINL